jgi:hypothetical protein
VLAQQPERVRRIGVLMSQVANDSDSLAQMGIPAVTTALLGCAAKGNAYA